MSKASSKSYIAYLKDGTQVSFTHAIDWSSGLRAGMTANPPGTPVAVPEAAPEGEKVSGITPITPENPEKELVAKPTEGKQPAPRKINK